MHWIQARAAAIEIYCFDRTMMAHIARFIESWSNDDAYDRFGSAGVRGQDWLAGQLARHERSALIAVNAGGVVGLLDHVEADGATHLAIVVDRAFRRRSIGGTLVRTLVQHPGIARPLFAQCDNGNYAARALLRACRFAPIEADRYQVTWRHE